MLWSSVFVTSMAKKLLIADWSLLELPDSAMGAGPMSRLVFCQDFVQVKMRNMPC